MVKPVVIHCTILDLTERDSSPKMESNGILTHVDVGCCPRACQSAISRQFAVVERGEIDVKGKGEMTVFLIGDVKSEGFIHHELLQHSRQNRRESIFMYQKISEELSLGNEESIDPLKTIYGQLFLPQLVC